MSEFMKGKIDISRPSCGDGREYISIRVKDHTSKVRFLEIEIDLDEFTKALTGMGETPCNIKCRNLNKVGRELISKNVEVEMGDDWPTSTSKSLANQRVLKLIEKTGKDWIIFSGFSSQNSFFKRDGKNYARTSLRRWV